jgi:hypothetical protein
MFLNTNLESIEKASKSHGLLRKYSDDLHFEFCAEKDFFKIVYLHMYFQDGGEYSEDDISEYFSFDNKKFNSIVRFHVGLFLPKTKSNVIKKVALEIISKMKYDHDHNEYCYYGNYEEFNHYIIRISDLIKIIKESVHTQEKLKATEDFILSHS